MDDLTGIVMEGVFGDNDKSTLLLPDPDLLAYYKFKTNRILFIEDEICDDTLFIMKDIMQFNLDDLGKDKDAREPIYLFINSDGGDVQIMWTIMKTIEMSTTPIYTVVPCRAMSAAAHILTAGHKRFAFPSATVLIHSGMRQFGGDAEKVESAKKFFDKMIEDIDDNLIEKTKIPKSKLKKKGANDWYFNAQSALEYGLVDEIVYSIEQLFGNCLK